MSKQLDFVDSELSRADSTMTRLKKSINYFSRNYMTDRLILCCIIVIMLILLAILFVTIFLPTQSKQLVDEVKK